MTANPNLAAYPYARTLSLLTVYGDMPSTLDIYPIAMWIRSQHGRPCTVDATGCTLSADFVQAIVRSTNWVRDSTPHTTRWPANVRWIGIDQAMREALSQVVASFPIQPN